MHQPDEFFPVWGFNSELVWYPHHTCLDDRKRCDWKTKYMLYIFLLSDCFFQDVLLQKCQEAGRDLS